MGQTPLPAPQRNVYFLFYPSVQLICPLDKDCFTPKSMGSSFHIQLAHIFQPPLHLDLRLWLDSVGVECGVEVERVQLPGWNRNTHPSVSTLPHALSSFPLTGVEMTPRKTLEVTWHCLIFSHMGSQIDCSEGNLTGVFHEWEITLYGVLLTYNETRIYQYFHLIQKSYCLYSHQKALQ